MNREELSWMTERPRHGWEANPWVWVIGFKKINARSDNE